jgi:hypothetical protein
MLFVCVLTPASDAQEVPEIFFAGFSFGGSAAEQERLYPHSAAVAARKSDRSNIGPLDRALLRRAKKIDATHYALLLPGIDTLDQAALSGARSKVLTVVLDGEFISVDRMSDHYQATVWLSGQILVFSFEERKIITSYPFGVRRKTAFGQQPTQTQIRSIISEMLLDPSTRYNPNFFDAFLERVEGMRITPNPRGRIQVGSVSIDKRSHSKLPTTYIESPQTLDNFRSFVATNFTKSFSVHTRQPVLPYLGSSPRQSERRIALNAGAYMARLMSQVADAKAYNLQVPEPDYLFNIRVLGFRKALLEENPGSQRWVFGSFAHITLHEPFRGQNLVGGQVRYPEIVDLPTGSGQQLDDWGEYRESLGRR